MSSAPTESKVPAIIRNEFFYAIARLCMILSLPVTGFFFSRMVSAADEVRSQLQAQNVALVLLTAEVKFRFAHVEDHEQRLRKLESAALR